MNYVLYYTSFLQLFDWLQTNKHTVFTILKENPSNKEGVLPTEVFQTLLRELGVFLSDEEWVKLLKIYDKKGGGSLNWEDLLTDHKYVHAVRYPTEFLHFISYIACFISNTSLDQMTISRGRK